MTHTINDINLINAICNDYQKIIGCFGDSNEEMTGQTKNVFTQTSKSINERGEDSKELEKSYRNMEHPLDNEVIGKLKDLIKDKKEIPYTCGVDLDNLWKMLLKKSINCLRFFDSREPFMLDGDKISSAYGIDELEAYHNRYTKFESLLYGASEYYRDHVFHVIRTWLIGVFCLLHNENEPFIDKIQIDGIVEKSPFAGKINFFEKLSIWTISALCHDLGYPLEKSQQILEKTKAMMKEFIPNPTVLSNFSFSGVQDSINEYIIRFMSTKMKEKTGGNQKREEGVEEDKEKNNTPKEFYGRIQPKYYLKYTKSLEKSNHGIISAIIIYKMLLYFIESDFNLNDDYIYTLEDARQFYIRREILRSISSHTCSDIYNTKNTTFSSLLFICDEMQEWGRKSWKDLYTNVDPSSVVLSIEEFNEKSIKYTEEIRLGTSEETLIIDNIFRIYDKQFTLYQLIFRDGQYTNERTFDIHKIICLRAETDSTKNNNIRIEFKLMAKGMNTFSIDRSDSKLKVDDIKKEFEHRIKSDHLPPNIIIS